MLRPACCRVGNRLVEVVVVVMRIVLRAAAVAKRVVGTGPKTCSVLASEGAASEEPNAR